MRPLTPALVFFCVILVNLACNVYASMDARGMYADAAGLVVVIYELKGFLLNSGPRAAVEIMRQAPVVFLGHYTSATLVQGAQLLTFVMLALPTLLAAICWWIAPRDRKAWALFPLLYLLIGFAATSMHAVGEAAIATSYYWILLFVLLFRTESALQRLTFLLLCIPAFWLHEGAFPLTLVLLIAVATRTRERADRLATRVFSGLSSVLLAAILAKQIYYVTHPLYPDDRAGIVEGLLHLKFVMTDNHFNTPLVTGTVALLTLVALFFVNVRFSPDNAWRYSVAIVLGWAVFALGAVVVVTTVEQSFSPFSQLEARYHPVFVSAFLGLLMIALNWFKLNERGWVNAPVLFVIILLCVTQSAADVVASWRWTAYVTDLRSRLSTNSGLVPWESTLRSGDDRKDINWRIFEIGWVVPFMCVIFAPNGVVRTMIDLPKGLGFRPLDPERPNDLPEIKGIDFGPYKRVLEATALGHKP